VLCFVLSVEFSFRLHVTGIMTNTQYFSVEHTSSVKPFIKYVVVITIIIICKPGSLKVVDFPAHNKQQFMH